MLSVNRPLLPECSCVEAIHCVIVSHEGDNAIDQLKPIRPCVRREIQAALDVQTHALCVEFWWRRIQYMQDILCDGSTNEDDIGDVANICKAVTAT